MNDSPDHALGTFRILVVDDNRDAAKTLSMLLGMTGHQTQVAHDGPEAIEAARHFLPEVILLDLGLPTLSGYDVCREIRKQDWGTQIVIIALTGWSQDDNRRKTTEAGFNGHLIKPVELDAIVKLLADLVPRRAART